MTEILEIFSLLLNTDKFQKCQIDNKKSSKSFSDLLLSLAAGGGWYSVLKVRVGWLDNLGFVLTIFFRIYLRHYN